MRKKQTIHIQDDEAFLEGINLITGLKINYDRPILTQSELNSLCIDERLSRKQKAKKILKSGGMQQKWSLFDNLTSYLHLPQDYEEILQLIEKYYEDLEPMLDMVAIGLLACVEQFVQGLTQEVNQNQRMKYQQLTAKSQQTLFRLCIRSFTDEKYNHVALDQWSQLFNQFFLYLSLVKSPKLNSFTDQCLQYISGSFSMTTPPERRRIAFQMIKGLIEHSQKIMQRSKTTAVFFNNDTNSKTRSVICEAMGKFLLLKPDDDQMRKYLFDYFHDEDPTVREKAFYVLVEIANVKHLEVILSSIEEEQNEDLISCLVLDNLQSFMHKFHHLIRESKRYKLTLLNLLNSALTSQDSSKTLKIFPHLIKIYNLIFVNKKQKEQQNFFNLFAFRQIDFEQEDNFRSLVELCRISAKDEGNASITHSFQFYLHKYTKSHKIKMALFKSIQGLKVYFSNFTYELQDQQTIYTVFLTKAIEESKWAQVGFLIEEMRKVPLNQQNFDKFSMSLFKLILHCPYYLLEGVCRAILYLLLSKRKHLEFFLSLKDKLNCSKSWMQRRNYIILYAEIKAGSSYEFHKSVPLLNYKLIAKEKCIGVKLQFLKYSMKIQQLFLFYLFSQGIDPESKLENMALKECVNQLCNDKDIDVSESANLIKKQIFQSQVDFNQLERNAQRNSIYMAEQELMKQKDVIMSKKIKTEKQIGRKESKSKTIAAESRTSIRIHKDLSKDFVKKQFSIANVQKIRRPSTVINESRALTKQKIQKNNKNEDEKKSSSSVNHKMPLSRIMSIQMKPGMKTLALRKQSGFKK